MNAPKHTKNTTIHPPRREASSARQPNWRGSKLWETNIPSMTPAPVVVRAGVQRSTTISLHEFLLKDRDRLIKSNIELEHFATLAAHDLKSPLHTAFSWLNILSEQLPDTKFAAVSESIEIIQRNLKNAISYVNELLQMSKATEEPPKHDVCTVSEIVTDILFVHAESLKKANAVVIKEDLPKINANQKQLECVFSNLIGNAIKYKHPERNLMLTIGSIERETVIEYFVKDNGIGIPTLKLEDIFTLFESFHSSSNERSTGIGLAFCRKVMSLHGGRIWAESSDGQGSTIRFQLPKEPTKHKQN